MAPVPFTIDSEAKALIFITGLLNDEFDLEELIPSFDAASWAKLSLHLEGDLFKASIPSSTMRGLLDFQNEFYRSVGWVLYGDDRISKLTEEDRIQFELVFSVDYGSTDLLADATKAMNGFVERAIDKMTSKDLAIAAVLVGAMYFGVSGIDRYLSNHTDVAKIEAQTHRDDQLIALVRDQREQTQKIIDEAIKQSESAQKIVEQNAKAMEALIKASRESDGVVLQGKSLSKKNIDDLNESQRQATQNVHLTMLCKVARIDARSSSVIYVRFDPLDKSEPVRASLSDPILGEKFRAVIEKATFTQDTISVTIVAKKRMDNT